MSPAITIAVVNHSTVVKDAEVQAAIAAFQTQVSRDFAPEWGRDATVVFAPANSAPAGAWQVIILDDSDQAGALGYHDLTAEGLPLSKVFAKTDQQYKLSWTVTASHEILEMLGDPFINQSALAQRGPRKGRLYGFEACDPVEADELGYEIGGVLVSDFVTMAWFWPGKKGPFDFCKQLSAPFTLAAGGYVGYLDLTSAKGWQQQTNRTALRRPQHPGSRREKRERGFEQWRRSTA